MPALSDLLYAALRVARVTDRPGRLPSSTFALEAMAIYNRMVGSWDNYEANIFEWLLSSYTFAANQQKYTFGPGGTGPLWLDPVRPSRIKQANLIISSTPNPIRRPINILDPQQWASKRVQQVFGPPLDIYDDFASPISTLYAWPIPDRTYPFELYTLLQLTTATALSNLIQLPPGYEEAVVYNLARRIPGAQLTTEDLKLAVSSLAAIQTRNTHSPRMLNDTARLGSRIGPRGDFNYYDGQPV